MASETQLIQKALGSDLRRNQTDATATIFIFEISRHHSCASPWAPVDGKRAALDSAAQTASHMIEGAVGCRIISLTAVAEAAGDAGKQRHEFHIALQFGLE